MSAKQDKRMRREVKKYLSDAGATQEKIREQWALKLKPCPWWIPPRVWAWMARRFLKDIPGLPGQLALVDDAPHAKGSRDADR